ncbi:MAG: hypothetical protein HLUCCX14_07230 [Marinobacter excellens HL-55]|uniref:Uncharacterized protein n=1 Tax=Marinobacter excellens HL-55 TaxID=1305731 RepID=A0A0P7ZIX0_9GAMM|nr:MAG: hypothetical protein HLUCCX14_07230 [Marinobacter excellens HL-55]
MNKILALIISYAFTYYTLIYEHAKSWNIDFNSLADSLITMSGLIFAIIGMWVSYSYPEAVQKLTQDNKDLEIIESVSRARRLESLIMTILISATILLTCLLAKAIIIPLASEIRLFEDIKPEIRSIGIGAAWFLVLIQSIAMLKIMSINLKFINQIYELIEKLELHRKVQPYKNSERIKRESQKKKDQSDNDED